MFYWRKEIGICRKMRRRRKKYVDWTASATKKLNRRGGTDREKNWPSHSLSWRCMRPASSARSSEPMEVKKATNASPKSTMCTDWKTIYQYYCRKISCVLTLCTFSLLRSVAVAFWLANVCAECRVAVGFNANRTERMSAHWFGWKRHTGRHYAVALKSRCLEMCPAFIVLAPFALTLTHGTNLYVHTCCYYVRGTLFHIHNRAIASSDCVCVCVCIVRTKTMATADYATKMKLCNATACDPGCGTIGTTEMPPNEQRTLKMNYTIYLPKYFP